MQRHEVRLLHLPAPRDLFDHQLRVAAHAAPRAPASPPRLRAPRSARGTRPRCWWSRRCARSPSRARRGGVARRVEHHRADRGRTGVATRAAVEVDCSTVVEHQGTRMRRSCRSRRWIPRRLLDLLRLDGRDRQVAPLAGGAHEPADADALCLRPAALVLGHQPCVEAAGDARRAARALDRISATISASAAARVRRDRASSSPATLPSGAARARRASASSGSRCSISSSSRFSTLRWCRRSCSTSACIACSSRGELISPEYILASTSFAFAPSERASSSRRVSSARASSSRVGCTLAVERASSSPRVAPPRARARRAPGSVSMAVEQAVERAVALLERRAAMSSALAHWHVRVRRRRARGVGAGAAGPVGRRGSCGAVGWAW